MKKRVRSEQTTDEVLSPFESRQRTRTLDFTIITLFVGSVILTVYNLHFHSVFSLSSLCALAVTCVVAFVLNRRDAYMTAAVLASAVTLAAITFNIYDGYGLFDSGVVAYPVYIILGSMLLGRRSLKWLTIASLASLFLIAYLQSRGMIHVNASAKKLSGLIPISTFMVLAAVIIRTIEKNAEEDLTAIRQSHQHLKQFSQGAFDGLSITDDGLIVEPNEQLAAMFGYTLDELAGKNMFELVASEDREKHVRLQAGETVAQELTGLRKDGTLFPIEIRRRPMRYYGKTVSVIAVRDLTAQKAEEATRREAERRYRDLFEHIRDAAFAVSSDGRILALNPAFQQMTGYAIADWIGKPFAELLHPDDLAHAIEAFERNVRGTPGPPDEFRLRKKNGSYLIAEVLLSGRVSGGPEAAHLGVARDVTERKALEEQVRRMQRLESLGTLAAGIAHDLNNALAPIMTGVQLLRDSSSDPTERGILSILESSAHRSREIVKQVLTFARGRSSEMEELQPRYMVNEIVSIIEKTFPKNIEVDSNSNKDLATIRGNATELQQVLMNLCVNARDAMETGGRLTVEARNLTLTEENRSSYGALQPNRYVEISVADTGEGIPSGIRDKIFDPFFTTKGPEKGTGLGLATVASIVRDHGGAVILHSEEGKGTTFSVCLPALSAAATEPAAEGSAEIPRGSGERVLVVDDEQSILLICRETLEAYGYVVETASNGAEAIALVAGSPEGTYRLVLTDARMPVVDGPSLVARLRRTRPNVAIIVMTGSPAHGAGQAPHPAQEKVANEGDQLPGAFQDANAVIPKPFTAEALLLMIYRQLHPSTEAG